MKKFTPIVAATLVLLLIAGGLYWYSYHVGVKEHMDRTVDAIAILEDGSELPCTVRFQGTLYVGHPSTEIDQFNGDYDGGIWINDCMILHSYSFNRVDEHGIMNGLYYLNRDMSVFAAKVDAADIFPEMESQAAYVVLKSNTPEEYSPILDQLMDSPLPTETTAGPALDLPPETTAPAESAPVIVTDFSEYVDLLDISADPNWLARSLGCLYEKPEDIDLYYMFYLGVGYPGSWNEISEESRQSLVDQGFYPEFDLQIMPAQKLEEALQETFGIGLAEVTIPESWGYIEAEDAYCSNHSDAYFPGVPVITSVEDNGDTVHIHYTIEGFWDITAEDFLDTANLILGLKRQEDGSLLAQFNVLAP